MDKNTSKIEGPITLAACTGEGCKELIIDWAREQGYTSEDVKILTRDETVWVQRRT